MIGVWMLCHDWCWDVMSCLLFVCYVMISVWMFCHDWCVDVMS